jgi:prolyl 4-hydroxylase
MKNISDYVMIVDDCISKDTCESLIDKFDKADDLVVRDRSWDQDYKSFKELNLTTHPEFKDEQTLFYDVSKQLYTFYEKKCGINFFPKEYGFEDVRMKRYNNDDKDQFGWHTDVGDYASARRYLVMFYYLNDVEEGGETAFDDKVSEYYLKVKSKQGRIVMFPPMWMYPHKGLKPISNPKYIISTYMHYL